MGPLTFLDAKIKILEIFIFLDLSDENLKKLKIRLRLLEKLVQLCLRYLQF